MPPRFLTMPATGIDISDRSVKYVHLDTGTKGKQISFWGDEPLEEGIVNGGKILSTEKLIAVLDRIRIKHGLSFVRAALPEEQIYFFTMTIPEGTKKELRNTIELSLEEHVPIRAVESLFDFSVLGVVGNQVEVAVVAVPRAVVDSYIEVFEKAGLTLLSLEIEPESIARSVIPVGDTEARMVVDFGDTHTGISVVQKGSVRFTSTIAIGGATLTDTLAKHFNVSKEEAEQMKKEHGLKKNTENQDLFALLLNNVAVLRDEINKHFIYWHTHQDEEGNQRPPITEIVLVGGDSNLSGLPSYLATSLHVKVTLGNVWKNVTLSGMVVPDISKNDSLGFATSIGLALTTYE